MKLMVGFLAWRCSYNPVVEKSSRSPPGRWAAMLPLRGREPKLGLRFFLEQLFQIAKWVVGSGLSRLVFISTGCFRFELTLMFIIVAIETE